MEIKRLSKLFDVLEAYPGLEEQIMNIAPPFKSLKNPVLRRTVAKLATLEKVAQVGGMDPDRLVNTLRKAVGQAELNPEPIVRLELHLKRDEQDPEWVSGEPEFIVNGTELLQHGEVPLGRVNELLGQLSPGRFLLLVTNFEPSPILEAMRKQERRVFHKTDSRNQDQHLTFIA